MATQNPFPRPGANLLDALRRRSALELTRPTFVMSTAIEQPVYFVSCRRRPEPDDETTAKTGASEFPVFVSCRGPNATDKGTANTASSWHATGFWTEPLPAGPRFSEAIGGEYQPQQPTQPANAPDQPNKRGRGMLGWCQIYLSTIVLVLAVISGVSYVAYTAVFRSRWLTDLDRGPEVATYFDVRCSIIDVEARWLGDAATRRRLARAGCTMVDLTPTDNSDKSKASQNGLGRFQGTRPSRTRPNPHPTQSTPREFSLRRFQ